MGWSMLQCTRPWPGIWSVFFVWGVEKPKTQSPADIARVKVGSCAALAETWCLAGCDVQQEGRHQRAKVVREEIITGSVRFMDKVFGQQQVERAWCLLGPAWWPITAGKAHPMVWGDPGLQPHHISLRLPKEKVFWDGFQLPAGPGRPLIQEAGLNGDCVSVLCFMEGWGKGCDFATAFRKMDFSSKLWLSLSYECKLRIIFCRQEQKEVLCVRSNFTLKASSREQDTILTAVEMEHVAGLGITRERS